MFERGDRPARQLSHPDHELLQRVHCNRQSSWTRACMVAQKAWRCENPVTVVEWDLLRIRFRDGASLPARKLVAAGVSHRNTRKVTLARYLLLTGAGRSKICTGEVSEMPTADARVALVERAEVAPADLPTYDHVAQSRGAGRMPNVFKALANNPAVMDKVAAVGEYMRFQSKLDPQLRELAILTTAQEIRCIYEWTAHYTIAEKLGVPAKLLNSIGTPSIELEP